MLPPKLGYGIDASLTHGAITLANSDRFYEPETILRWPSTEIPVDPPGATCTPDAAAEYFHQIAAAFSVHRPRFRNMARVTCLIDFDVTSVHWKGQAGAVVRLAVGLGVLRELLKRDLTLNVGFIRPLQIRHWLGLKGNANKELVWSRLQSLFHKTVPLLSTAGKHADDVKDAVTLSYAALSAQFSGGHANVITLAGPPVFPEVAISCGQSQATSAGAETSPADTPG